MNLDTIYKMINENNMRIHLRPGDRRPIQQNYELLELWDQKTVARKGGVKRAHALTRAARFRKELP